MDMVLIKEMSRLDKVRAIRKACGVKARLSWGKLCSLTEFDSFSTCFAFGFGWKESCPDDRLLTMDEKYLNMILYNVTRHPKAE